MVPFFQERRYRIIFSCFLNAETRLVPHRKYTANCMYYNFVVKILSNMIADFVKRNISTRVEQICASCGLAAMFLFSTMFILGSSRRLNTETKIQCTKHNQISLFINIKAAFLLRYSNDSAILLKLVKLDFTKVQMQLDLQNIITQS